MNDLFPLSVSPATYLMFILPLTAKVISCRSKIGHIARKCLIHCCCHAPATVNTTEDSLQALEARKCDVLSVILTCLWTVGLFARGPEMWRFVKLYWPVCEQWAYSLEARKCDVLSSYWPVCEQWAYLLEARKCDVLSSYWLVCEQWAYFRKRVVSLDGDIET